MSEFMDMISQRLNGVGDAERKRKIKADADAAAGRYAADNGTEQPPEEEGLKDADFLPGAGDEQASMELTDVSTGQKQRVPMANAALPGPGRTSPLNQVKAEMPAANTFTKTLMHSPDELRALQDEMNAAGALGTREGDIKAKQLLDKIRALRDSSFTR